MLDKFLYVIWYKFLHRFAYHMIMWRRDNETPNKMCYLVAILCWVVLVTFFLFSIHIFFSCLDFAKLHLKLNAKALLWYCFKFMSAYEFVWWWIPKILVSPIKFCELNILLFGPIFHRSFNPITQFKFNTFSITYTTKVLKIVPTKIYWYCCNYFFTTFCILVFYKWYIVKELNLAFVL